MNPMKAPTPEFLIAHPELVAPAAPWCARLDPLELGLVLLAQPWLTGAGLRRAQLERRLSHWARDLPLGAVYFQRVDRAVARLEAIGALRSEGGGRARRFVATPEGFAAFVVNLRVLQADPTVDGREFELKRALVAMWSVAFRQLSELADDLGSDPELSRFLDEAERLEIWGQRVLTDRLMRQALDVVGLISIQRRRVQELLERTRRRLDELAAREEPLDGVDISRVATALPAGAAAPLLANPATAEVVRALSTLALPAISLRAQALRYRRYLDYLDDLSTFYAEELDEVDLAAVRRARPESAP